MAQYEVSTGIGLRNVRVALRDADTGIIALPNGETDLYEGLQISGALALTLTIPDPQRVTARGDDRAYHTFNLPPTENPTGELRVSKSDAAVLALLSGTKVYGSPTGRKVGFGTDKIGLEPNVVLWGCREAIDSEEGSITFGQRVWQTYILLNAQVTVKPATMEDSAIGEITFSVVANNSAYDELGNAFSENTHGFTKAPYIMVVTPGQFRMGIQPTPALTPSGYTLLDSKSGGGNTVIEVYETPA